METFSTTGLIQHYLDRIHFSLSEGMMALEPTLQTLQALHQAHLLAVPFENLSIHSGQPISLQQEALYEKIVLRQRGGFCYELNGLFAWLLRQVGFQVSLLSAGVARQDGSFSPAFDHLTLLVHRLSGADWVADVGFGDSFLLPLRLETGVEQEGGDGRVYRLVRNFEESEDQAKREYWLVQQYSDEVWEAQYRFTLEPHALSDFTERCHYQQTSPESHFTKQRICSLATPTGRLTLSDQRFIRTAHGKREERLVESQQEYQDALAKWFGVVVEMA
jgi:N-hydroxyarylamine O-acetyltransferase